MSEQRSADAEAAALAVAMVPREHSEEHRQSSWLELLFDLTVVVAVAQAAAGLEHIWRRGSCARG
ncbi:MAG: hypothetical protein R2991_01785 [Thermoanaerobaculia bacterium]